MGHWGAVFISLGVLISVLGAYLAWSLICAEVLSPPPNRRTCRAIFAVQNGQKVPANALWLTNIVVSLFVISTYWSRDAFNFMLDLTSVTTLLPYLLVAGYGVLIARRGEGYEAVRRAQARRGDLLDCRSLYARHVHGGVPQYVLLVAVLYVPGTIMYAWARREQKLPLFSQVDVFIFAATAAAGLAGFYGLLSGTITPDRKATSS